MGCAHVSVPGEPCLLQHCCGEGCGAAGIKSPGTETNLAVTWLSLGPEAEPFLHKEGRWASIPCWAWLGVLQLWHSWQEQAGGYSL